MVAAGVTLRPMTRADREAALDIWTVSWTAAYPAIDFSARRDWIASRLDELERAGALAHVALDGQRIVGLVTIDPATGYLDQLVVATTHQRRGIAAALIDEAKRNAPKKIELHVNQDNARAISFYRKLGFSITGESANERSGAKTYAMRWSA